MKKITNLFLFLTLLCFFPVTTLAFDLSTGVCYNSECEVWYTGEEEKMVVPSGQVLSFKATWEVEEDDFSHVIVDVSHTGLMSFNGIVNESSSVYNLSSTGNSHKFTLINSENPGEGDAIIKIKMPTTDGISSIEKVTITVKVFNTSGSVVRSEKFSGEFAAVGSGSKYSKNRNLTNIKISNGTMQPAFDKDVFAYMITTDSATIDLEFFPEDSKTKIFYYGDSISSDSVPKEINGKLTLNLNYGENGCVIGQESEFDRMMKVPFDDTYTLGYGLDFDSLSTSEGGIGMKFITIVRNDNRSAVNTLKTLTVSDASFDFKSNVKNYNLTVPNDVSKVTINSTLTDAKSTYVKGFGNRSVDLKEGSNKVLIKVKAENGKENVYTLNITRELSGDNTLKEIKVNEEIVKVNDNLLQYTVTVKNEVTTAVVSATANHGKAKVEISKLESLVEGENEVTITVTAADGMKKIYSLIIKRDTLVSNNSNLKLLEVVNYNLDFNSNIKDYNLKIQKEDKLDIKAEAEHEKAKVLITGNKDLETGSVIKIKVTAEDGTISNYSITIEKEKDNMMLFLIIGAGVLFLIILIIIIVSSKKKKAGKEQVVNVQVNQETLPPIDEIK